MNKQTQSTGSEGSTMTQEKQPDLHIIGKREKVVLNWTWEEIESGKKVLLMNLSDAVNNAIANETIGDGLKQCFSRNGGAAATNYVALKLMELLWKYLTVEGVDGDKLEVTVPEKKMDEFISAVKRGNLAQELQKNMATNNKNLETLLNEVPDFDKDLLAMSMKSFKLDTVTLLSTEICVDKPLSSRAETSSNAAAPSHRSNEVRTRPNVQMDYTEGVGSKITHKGKGIKFNQFIDESLPKDVKVAGSVAVGGGTIEYKGDECEHNMLVGKFTAEHIRAVLNK